MKQFSLDYLKGYRRRYNVAPTQDIPALKSLGELSYLHWGLIPSWAKDAAIGNKMINARAETITEKASYKRAFQKRRCLIVSGGFYEWKQIVGGKKQPYFIHMKDGSAFAFAGLWETWKSPQGEVIESTTIITTDANDLLKEVHDRMPVIIPKESYETWLSPEATPENLIKLLKPYSSVEMEFYPVSTIVNKPSNDDPTCLERIAAT